MSERIVLYYSVPTPLEVFYQRAMHASSYAEARPDVELLLEYQARRQKDEVVVGWIAEIRKHHNYEPPLVFQPASPRNLPQRPEPDEQIMMMENAFYTLVTKPAAAKAVVAKLHELMDRQVKPKDVLMPLRAAMDAGALKRPTWEGFQREFGETIVKQKSSFSKYTNPQERCYEGAAYEVMVHQFGELIL